MGDYYPVPEPFDEGMLPLSDVHTMYYFQCGNPKGKPVVFLHGGPGGATSLDVLRVFNPEVYRVVAFDQRGAGKSTPTADLTDNDTQHIIGDIETLRKHVGVDKWLVYGGSWGSTLALAYAQTHPDRCTELVLRGIFLGRKWELEWFTGPIGIASIFPDAYQQLLTLVPPEKRDHVQKHYYEMIQSSDEKVALKAAQEWSRWESACSRLIPSPEDTDRSDHDLKWARAIARIELHFFVNNIFLKEGQLISEEEISKIRHIPCIIVHGRYDVICPATNAFELKQAYGDRCQLRYSPEAGHSSKDPGNEAGLKKALDEFAQ